MTDRIMAEAGQTEGPWVANGNHSGDGWRIETDAPSYPNDGWIIAELHGPDAKANAAHIVRCVNSHDELVEALKEARAALHQHYVDWDGEPEDAVPLQLARSRCDEAIARAQGTAS